MHTITPVTMFPCPITGKLYKTARGAQNSAKREQKRIELEKQAEIEAKKSKEERESEINWLRLNLEDINDLSFLMSKRVKELYDWDLDVNINLHFTEVSNSHHCPINGVTNWSRKNQNAPISYPGWSGNICGSLKGHFKNTSISKSISDYIREKFKCIHFTGGCPGRPNEYNIRMSMCLFLDDFPILKEKYEKYKIEYDKETKNRLSLIDLKNRAVMYCNNDPEVIKARELMHRTILIEKNLLYEKIENYMKENQEDPIPYSEDYPQLKAMFN